MGFLDQEQRLRQTELAAEQVKQAEKTRLAIAAGKQLAIQMQTEEEDRRHGPEDNAKIEDLLDNLSGSGLHFPAYLGLVQKHTGYSSILRFYTRDKNFRQIDRGLTDKLGGFGINFEGGYEARYYRDTMHPGTMFCGTGIRPKIICFGGFMNLIPTNQFISEPQEPGIGICFEKKDERVIGRYSRPDSYSILTQEFERSETTTQFVFARLLPPATAFITGSGQRIPITSMEVLDNALEEGFKHYHVGKERQEREIYRDIAG